MIKSKLYRGTAKKQKLVTVIGVNYIEEIVPELLEKAFNTYYLRDFSKKNFQSSVYENAHATSAIVLTVLGIEAYRNRIYYLEKKKVGKNVSRDLTLIFSSKDKKFPNNEFEEILGEVFVIRDVIVHNHIYEVDVYSDDNWEMIGHRQRLLEGYGDDKKYKAFVNKRARKTKILKLNVQPGKIGFEDLFKVLVLFDLFVGVSIKYLGRGYVYLRFSKKINNNWEDSFSAYLAQFYNSIPNNKYKSSLKHLLNSLKSGFAEFTSDSWDRFLYNSCPECKEFGYRQLTIFINVTTVDLN